MSLDPKYVSDMKWMLHNYNFLHNNSAPQQMFEALLAKQKNGRPNWTQTFPNADH